VEQRHVQRGLWDATIEHPAGAMFRTGPALLRVRLIVTIRCRCDKRS
jgi:hypothetical protein